MRFMQTSGRLAREPRYIIDDVTRWNQIGDSLGDCASSGRHEKRGLAGRARWSLLARASAGWLPICGRALAPILKPFITAPPYD